METNNARTGSNRHEIRNKATKIGTKQHNKLFGYNNYDIFKEPNETMPEYSKQPSRIQMRNGAP